MPDPRSVRRWYAAWLLGVASLLLVSGVGTAVTYVQARPLLTGPTQPVQGTVIRERAGFLGVRNLVEVEYEAGGALRRAEIPVKGNGLAPGGGRLDPYFYAPGQAVALLVDRSDPAAVRTATRWTPAVHNWLAVLGFASFLLVLLLVVRRVTLRANGGRPNP